MIITCRSPTLPTAKKYRQTQYSTIKRRSGRESVPFLGLDGGLHRVKFWNDKKEVELSIKTWLSPYGYAWRVVK